MVGAIRVVYDRAESFDAVADAPPGEQPECRARPVPTDQSTVSCP
jgi:hypothetical protein